MAPAANAAVAAVAHASSTTQRSSSSSSSSAVAHVARVIPQPAHFRRVAGMRVGAVHRPPPKQRFKRAGARTAAAAPTPHGGGPVVVVAPRVVTGRRRRMVQPFEPLHLLHPVGPLQLFSRRLAAVIRAVLSGAVGVPAVLAASTAQE